MKVWFPEEPKMLISSLSDNDVVEYVTRYSTLPIDTKPAFGKIFMEVFPEYEENDEISKEPTP